LAETVGRARPAAHRALDDAILVADAEGKRFSLTEEERKRFARQVDTNGDGKVGIDELNEQFRRGQSVRTRLLELTRAPANSSGCVLPETLSTPTLTGPRVALAGRVVAWLSEEQRYAGTVSGPCGAGTSVFVQTVAHQWRSAALGRRQAYIVDAAGAPSAA